MSGQSVSHYQQRARGVCALCARPLVDDDDRLHHEWCDRLYNRGWRVRELRALTDVALRVGDAIAETRAIRDQYAVKGSRHLLLVSEEDLIELALGRVGDRVGAQAQELLDAIQCAPGAR